VDCCFFSYIFIFKIYAIGYFIYFHIKTHALCYIKSFFSFKKLVSIMNELSQKIFEPTPMLVDGIMLL
jgi:hypothetical protein